MATRPNTAARTLFLEGRDFWDLASYRREEICEALTNTKAEQSGRTAFYRIDSHQVGPLAMHWQRSRTSRKLSQSTWKTDVEEKEFRSQAILYW
jgi:hypothetical protein